METFFDYIFRTAGGRFIFLCNYDIRFLKFNVPLFYLEILRAWQEMENNRNYHEGKINPIFRNNKDYLCKGKMIFCENLYRKNIYLVKQILEKDRMRSAVYFHRLGLDSENIVKVWEIGEVVVRSQKFEGNIYDFYSVDKEEYNISLKIFENVILLKDVSFRKVYELFVTNSQQLYILRMKDGQNDYLFSKKGNYTFIFKTKNDNTSNKT